MFYLTKSNKQCIKMGVDKKVQIYPETTHRTLLGFSLASSH